MPVCEERLSEAEVTLKRRLHVITCFGPWDQRRRKSDVKEDVRDSSMKFQNVRNLLFGFD